MKNLEDWAKRAVRGEIHSADLIDIIGESSSSLSIEYFIQLYLTALNSVADVDHFKLIMSIPVRALGSPFIVPKKLEVDDSKALTITMLPRTYDLVYERIEEYRAPIDLAPQLGLPDDVVCLFRSIRKNEAIQYDWEYDSYVTVYHYPEELRF